MAGNPLLEPVRAVHEVAKPRSTPANRIVAGRREIAELLWLRDEKDLARAMLVAPEPLHRRVMERAAEPTVPFPRRDSVDELLVIAAIAELEGVVRAPARWTPRSAELAAGLDGT